MIVPDEIFVPGNIIMPYRTIVPDSIHKCKLFVPEIFHTIFVQIELEELFTVFGNLGVEVRQEMFWNEKN